MRPDTQRAAGKAGVGRNRGAAGGIKGAGGLALVEPAVFIAAEKGAPAKDAFALGQMHAAARAPNHVLHAFRPGCVMALDASPVALEQRIDGHDDGHQDDQLEQCDLNSALNRVGKPASWSGQEDSNPGRLRPTPNFALRRRETITWTFAVAALRTGHEASRAVVSFTTSGLRHRHVRKAAAARRVVANPRVCGVASLASIADSPQQMSNLLFLDALAIWPQIDNPKIQRVTMQ